MLLTKQLGRLGHRPTPKEMKHVRCTLVWKEKENGLTVARIDLVNWGSFSSYPRRHLAISGDTYCHSWGWGQGLRASSE